MGTSSRRPATHIVKDTRAEARAEENGGSGATRLARRGIDGADGVGPGGDVGQGEGGGGDGAGKFAQLDGEVVMVVVSATEGGGVRKDGGGYDRQVRRLPPPPMLHSGASEIRDVRLDGRRAYDVLQV